MRVRLLCQFMIISALFALNAPLCQSQIKDERIRKIVEAVNQNHPNQAIEVLLANPAPFDPKDREQLIDAFSRNAPSGEWVPFLQKLCKTFPQDADYRYILARTYWRSGDEKAALVECGEVLRLSPNDQLLLYRIAAIAYATNEFTKAKEWLSRLLEMDPNNLDGMLLFGTVLAREGNDQAAKPYLEKVLAMEPGHALANFELGKLANREGDSQRAETYLKQAISGYPFFREAVNALLVALSRQKKMDELKETQEIFEYLRGWPASKLNRMMYVFRNSDKASPKEAEQLSIELSKVKRSDLAERYIQNRLDVGIASEQEKLLLARIYYNQQDYPKAAGLLDALDEDAFSKSLLYVYLRSLALLRTNRAPEAQAFYAAHAPNFPDSAELKSIGKLLSRATQSSNDDNEKSAKPDYAIRFVDVTNTSGLQTFQHKLGAANKPWITDAMGSGVAVGDYDNDGDDDIYFTNGRPSLDQPDENWRNALFRNDGGKFVDVTNETGAGDMGFGMVSVFGDVNNDGWLDIFVGNIGPNALYISNGDGTFSERGKEAGIDDAGYCAAAAFVDIDLDGDLDLYVGNYIDFDPKRDGEKRLDYHGEDVFVGPLVFNAQPDLLYLNDGNGVFTNQADQLGLPKDPSRAMGAVFFDLENDGDLDLYITNDSTFNTVLENKGDGHFDDVSFPSGGAFTENGAEGASMGIAPGDYN
ncbi:FG-GAP-like repeat-containing protein, partial [bacterium]|nr:FG-GAP-like repeat-containing protein [bacterium]